MRKATISIGYKEYVLEVDKALQVLEILSEAEVYENKWNGKDVPSTHHIYEQDPGEGTFSVLKIMPAALYKLAKLAGKPTDNN